MKRLITCMLAIAVTAVFIGCPPKEDIRKQQGVMDTPAHHVEMAERAVMAKDWVGAHKEYRLAIGLDPNYVPALIGNAAYFAYKNEDEKAEEYRERAWKSAKGDDKKLLDYYVGVIRYYKFKKGKDWLENAEDAFERAKKLDPENEKLHFLMGEAYLTAYKFEKAEDMFRAVVKMNGSLRHNADVLWKKTQDIVRARPGSVAAKKIALVEKITKADVAALFVEEMHLPELWRKRGIKKWEKPKFMTPDQAARAKKKDKSLLATDIENHPLRRDIEAVIKLGIRGLEVGPDGKFYPNKPVTKAEYAVMLEDVLVKVLNEPGISSKYAGESESKFHDMRTSHWAYNAAVVITSRGMMPPDMEGNFKPMKAVSGSDALLVIRQMMDYLRIG